MIKLTEGALDAWLRYYYAANGVAYIIRQARKDVTASSLSMRPTDELLAALNISLGKRPEGPDDVVMPYIIVAALAMKGDVPEAKLLEFSAQHTKWYEDYVHGLFSQLNHSKLIVSNNAWRMTPKVPSTTPKGSSLMSNSTTVIDGTSR